MNPLKEFIDRRRREIEESLAPLRSQHAEITKKIESLERELADLITAGKAIGIVKGIPLTPLGVQRRQPPAPTIKEAIILILQEFPRGLIALDILAKINERFSLSLVRTSLSPQLTRLKREGKILNQGNLWRLPQKNEGSDHGTEPS